MDITTVAELIEAMADADETIRLAMAASMNEMLRGEPIGMSVEVLEGAATAYTMRADLWDMVPLVVKDEDPSAVLLCRASGTCAVADREIANVYRMTANRARIRIARTN